MVSLCDVYVVYVVYVLNVWWGVGLCDVYVVCVSVYGVYVCVCSGRVGVCSVYMVYMCECVLDMKWDWSKGELFSEVEPGTPVQAFNPSVKLRQEGEAIQWDPAQR